MNIGKQCYCPLCSLQEFECELWRALGISLNTFRKQRNQKLSQVYLCRPEINPLSPPSPMLLSLFFYQNSLKKQRSKFLSSKINVCWSFKNDLPQGAEGAARRQNFEIQPVRESESRQADCRGGSWNLRNGAVQQLPAWPTLWLQICFKMSHCRLFARVGHSPQMCKQLSFPSRKEVQGYLQDSVSPTM